MLRHPAGEPLADLHLEQLHGVLGIPFEHLAGERDGIAHASIPVDLVDPDVVVVGQGAGLRDDRLADGPDVGQAVESCREVLDRAHASGLVGNRPIQPRVLECHCRLVRERLEQRDLVLGPWAIGAVIEADDAHGTIAGDQRDEACGADALGRIDLAHHTDGGIAVRVSHPAGPALADGSRPDGIRVGRQRPHLGQERLAEVVVRGNLVRVLGVVHDPESGLVRLEQRPGQLDHASEQRGEVEGPGELLGDGPERAGSTNLAPRVDDEPRACQRGSGHGRECPREGIGHPLARRPVDHEHADHALPRAQADDAVIGRSRRRRRQPRWTGAGR